MKAVRGAVPAAEEIEAPIYVTRPELPPLEAFIPYLRKIWDSKILTNGGPFHQELERKLCEYLGVNHIALFANGTLGAGDRAAGPADHAAR